VRNKVGQAFSLPDFLSRGGGAMKWALTIAAFAARRAPKTQAKAPAPPWWEVFSLPDFCHGR
jgi:hypothetical protein